ncbi:MAG: hypothetical protein IKQ46_06500 [Bacteroidales bacterium]|nr:hypothetical protein [Bacteroidales bacterium]
MIPEYAKKIGTESEFTPEMHYSMLSGECSYLEIMVMAARAETKNGMSLSDACKKYKITVQDFRDNYEKVFPGSLFKETFPDYLESK